MLDEVFDEFASISKKFLELNPNCQDLSSSSRNLLDEDSRFLEIDEMDIHEIKRLAESYKEDDLALLFILQSIEGSMLDMWKKQIWDIHKSDYQYIFSSLNSEENVRSTNLAIFPRFVCNWAGRSTESTHESGINVMLSSLFVFDLGTKIAKKYKIIGHYLNPLYFKLMCNKDIILGASPVSSKIEIQEKFFCDKDKNKTKKFDVVISTKDSLNLINIIESILRKMDSDGCDIVVFPEMIGSEEIDKSICQSLERKPLKNIKIIVLPSYHRTVNKHNENSSSVICYDGEELFKQQKIIKYTLNIDSQNYVENIFPGKEIHILHMDGMGSAAVLICRSELETDVRRLLNELKVKLIMSPSWSTGDYDFGLSVLGEGEHDINTIWCNTCSAYDDLENHRVCIISGFSRNKEISDLTNVSSYKYNDTYCDGKCTGNCRLVKAVPPRNYKEEERENKDEIR